MAIGTTNADAGDGPLTDTRTLRQHLESVRASLVLERASFDSHWREISDFLRPRRTRFQITDRNKGDKRNQNIIDSTATFAARTLQSGLHAGLTSPARPWMRLTVTDPDLAEYDPVKLWLDTVTRRLLDIFLRSNLYNALPTLYGDLGMFGTAAMGILEDDEDLLRCYTYPLGSYAMGIDARGRVNVFVREYEMTVRQLVQMFGRSEYGQTGMPMRRRGDPIDWSRFSQTVKNLWTKGEHDQAVPVTWVVGPNEDYDDNKFGSKYYKFHSCWYENGREGDGEFLRRSGFREFPIVGPRWEVTSSEDTYGEDCPGMMALGDVKSLQIMRKRKAQAVDKALNPSLQGPSSLRTQKVSLLPGDITYVDARDQTTGLRPIHEVRLEGIGELSVDIQDVRYLIRRSFFEDLFLMLSQNDRTGSQPFTAREVDERHEEKLLALGPVVERSNEELHSPLVDRGFAMLQRAGGMPPPPPELRDMDLKVEFISVLSQAQKAVGWVGQQRWLELATGLMQAGFPEARHKVRPFQVMDSAADMLGVDPRIVRPDDEAQELVDQDARAAAAAQQAEQLKTVAQAGQMLGKTPMEGNTALSAVMGNQGAPAA